MIFLQRIQIKKTKIFGGWGVGGQGGERGLEYANFFYKESKSIKKKILLMFFFSCFFLFRRGGGEGH